MNKLHIFCAAFAIFMCTSMYSSNSTQESIHITFSATKATGRKTEATSEEFNYCMEMLKNLTTLSKKRNLTTEEIVMALQLINYVFATANDDYSKKIVVTLHGKHKLELPFSDRLFAILQQFNNQGDDQEEEYQNSTTAA